MKIKTASLRLFFDRIIFACSFAALLAVVTGASVAPATGRNSNFLQSLNNNEKLAPVAVGQCDSREFIQKILDFRNGNPRCDYKSQADSVGTEAHPNVHY